MSGAAQANGPGDGGGYNTRQENGWMSRMEGKVTDATDLK